MIIISSAIFIIIGIIGLLKSRNNTTKVKSILIISSLLLITIQVLFFSEILHLGELELLLLSTIIALVDLIFIFKKPKTVKKL